jgi:LAO/AO transport system kinase
VHKPPVRRRRSLNEYVDGVLAGDRVLLAQTITLLESTLASDRDLAEQILERLLPAAGNSVRVGITGVPGVGKSTFIEALGTHLADDRGERVAVLAVDPSSAVSGGSILGDKTRMPKLSVNERAFIRPSPSRGSLGGVGQRTRETILACEAAGYSNVLVETVGVGQSETLVATMVDFFLLLMLPGSGDELQGIKRGIIEVTDLVAVNKSDGDNRQRAELTQREFTRALAMFPPPASGWPPRVVTCSAAQNTGIAEIWDSVRQYCTHTRENGYFERRRREQDREWMHQLIVQGLRDRLFSDPAVQRRLAELEQAVANGRVTSFRAARELLETEGPSNARN